MSVFTYPTYKGSVILSIDYIQFTVFQAIWQ